MAWTDEQDKHLVSERAKGSSLATIARDLGKTEGSVKRRLWRIANRKALFEPQGPRDSDR
jgi:IS30 family transposase